MESRSALSRRSFVQASAGIAVGAACIAGASATPAAAEEAKAPELPAWLEPEPQIADADISETVDCDVVVCGGGCAGLFAACSAAENGAKTVMIEQHAKDCGSGVRDDLAVCGSRIQQEEGCPLDPMELANAIQEHSSWYCNQRLFKVWADESGEAFDWYADRLADAGYSVKHQLVNPPADQVRSYSTCCGVEWGTDGIEMGSTANNGQYILNPYAESIGVDCRWETKLVKCLKDGDRVSGIVALKGDGTYLQVNAAKGVILCCGGYLGNPDMMAAIQPDVEKVTVYNWTWPDTNGDGIKAGIWAGGLMDPCHSVSSWEQGLVPPNKTVAESHDVLETFWLGPLPYLRVNLDGKRFMNESGAFDSLGHALQYQPDHTAVCVFDSSWKEDAEQFNVYGAHRYFPYDNGLAPLFTIDYVEEVMMPQIEQGLIVQADTIEELAKKIGVPVENLVETVERYNELCAAGRDDDFGKPAYRLAPVDEPPYYAVRFAEQGSHTMDGLVIDEDMRVLDENLKPIAGLYAAGDNSGAYLGVTYLGNAAGNAAGRSITFGRHAGRVAALSE